MDDIVVRIGKHEMPIKVRLFMPDDAVLVVSKLPEQDAALNTDEQVKRLIETKRAVLLTAVAKDD